MASRGSSRTRPPRVNLSAPRIAQEKAEAIIRTVEGWTDATITWAPDSMSAIRNAWMNRGARAEITALIVTDTLARTTVALNTATPLARGVTPNRDEPQVRPPEVLDAFMICPYVHALATGDRKMRDAAEAGVWMIVPGDNYALRFPAPDRSLVLVAQPTIHHHEGMLHRINGPTIEWHDPAGVSQFYREGIRVNEKLVTGRATITLKDIRAEPNIELRRLMIEAYGYDRYFRNSRAKLLQQDDYGKLWRIPGLKDVEDFIAVEVVNATADPDGTFRRFFLRVPATMKTAREAVAWTFDSEPESYRISIES